MYPQFFGFDKLPFRLRPDMEFLYSGQEYQRARAELIAAFGAGRRVVLLSGPPGVGKTLLLEDVLGEIAGQFAICRINQPQVSPAELLEALLLQLGARPAELNADVPRLMAEFAANLGDAGARGGAALLVVDDAHLLTGSTLRILEELLSRAPRLKILLAAQSCARPGGRDFAGRIPAALHQVRLQALSGDEAKLYVERRLAVAGAGAKGFFTADAHAAIFQLAGGAARLINVLCDAALHAACMRATGQVSAAEVHLAVQDSRWAEALGRHSAMTNAPTLEAPAPTVEAPAEGPAQLLVSHGAEPIGAWPLKTGRVSIGRAVDNEVCLAAPCISRHHCQVVTVGNVSTIEDLGSVNGIAVNGKFVKRHVLQNQDKITLGDHMMTYVAG
jgi:type II secretory pathway predicted ATPase ExeA